MPDQYGLPTVREKELEYELQVLRRENMVLRAEQGMQLNAPVTPVIDKRQELVAPVQQLPLVGDVTVDWDNMHYRITGVVRPHSGELLHLQMFMSDALWKTMDPHELMLHQHTLVIRELLAHKLGTTVDNSAEGA